MTLQTSRRSWPAAVGAAFVATMVALTLTESALAQGIPNPLVRPQRGAETVPTQQPGAGAPSTGGQTQRGATAAPPASRGATGGGRIGGEGLPAESEDRAKTVAETLAGLYVSAVIGDRAVLRGLDVRTVPILAGTSVVGGAGGGGGAGVGGAGGGVGGGGVGIGGNNVAGLRSQVFHVRNGEVMSLFDRLRVLVRVRDTTVTLFDVTDVPPGQYDPLDLMDRGFPVAFRGSIDSVQALPPVPPTLIAPGQGVDGEAFERARNTSGDANSGGGNTNRGSTGGAGLPGNP
jgi:hypothetical protein